MRTLLLLFLFTFTIIAGVSASALSPGVSVGAFSNSPSGIVPGPSSTSYRYAIGYSVVLSVNNQMNVTVANKTADTAGGPAIGGISVALGLGYGYVSENYSSMGVASGEPAIIIAPPNYVTVTQIENHTVTTTVTKTITLPNGETTVVTEIKTVTIPSDSGPRIRPEVLGLGALAALLFLLAIRLR